MARLLVGAGTRAAVALGAVNGLGRGASNVLMLLDERVSKHHCVIEQRGGGFVLRDLGSTNGTFVNGQREDGERVLAHGDEIAVGAAQLRFELENAAAATETEAVPARPVAGVAVEDAGRAIASELRANGGLPPFEEVAHDPQRLRLGYEKLRMIAELTRAVASERDLPRLLDKVLDALLGFVRADRGVILLAQPDGSLRAVVARRREGSTLPVAVSTTILTHVIRQRASVLTPDALQAFGGVGAGGGSVALNRISSAIAVPLLHEGELYGAVWLDSPLLAQFDVGDLELTTGVANQAAMFIANAVLGQRIERETRTREQLSRLLSPNVAEQVIHGGVEVAQGGVYVPRCTVFNSDIRGFTHLSEGISPQRMVGLLNDYFELMVEIVFRHEGTLDKFMGDGLMALWGVPLAHVDDEARAVRCGLEMIEALAARAPVDGLRFQIGIGITTGPLVAGYVGSSRALSYTVIGDTANTSARLCSVAAPGQILVSEATAAALSGEFQLGELPPATLKGKERPVRVFTVTHHGAAGAPPR